MVVQGEEDRQRYVASPLFSFSSFFSFVPDVKLPSSGSFCPALSRLPRSPKSASSFSYLRPLLLVDVHAPPSVPLHRLLVLALSVVRVGTRRVRRAAVEPLPARTA